MQYTIVSVNLNTMSVLHHSLYLNLCQIVVLRPLWSTKVFVSNQVNTIKTALLTANLGAIGTPLWEYWLVARTPGKL